LTAPATAIRLYFNGVRLVDSGRWINVEAAMDKTGAVPDIESMSEKDLITYLIIVITHLVNGTATPEYARAVSKRVMRRLEAMEQKQKPR
jgi:hypothetical protein